MIDDDDELRALYEGIDRIPEPLLARWISEIASGVRGSEVDARSRSILRDFVLRQHLGQPQSKATLDWLADMIDGVLDHQDPRALLGLSPRPKHRLPDPWSKAAEVAIWLMQVEARGYEPAEAASLAAAVFSKDLKSIERYRRDGGKMLEWVNPSAETWEVYFERCKPPRPLPLARNKNSTVPVPTRAKRK